MEKQLVESYYFDIKTIIASAFLGVLSFQILVPLGIEYLNVTFGLPWWVAYRFFIVVYFLIIPLGFIFWLIYHYDIVKFFLPPFDGTTSLTRASKIYLLLLLIVCFLGIVFHFDLSSKGTSISDSLWKYFIFFTVSSLSLLGMSFYFGRKLVQKNIKLDKDWKKGYYKSLIISFVAYFLIVLSGYLFVKHGGETTLTTSPITYNYKLDLDKAQCLLNKKQEVENIQKEIVFLNRYLSIVSSGETPMKNKCIDMQYDSLIRNTIELTRVINEIGLLVGSREDTLQGEDSIRKKKGTKFYLPIDTIALSVGFARMDNLFKETSEQSKGLFDAHAYISLGNFGIMNTVTQKKDTNLSKCMDSLKRIDSINHIYVMKRINTLNRTDSLKFIDSLKRIDTMNVYRTKVIGDLLQLNGAQIKQMTQRFMGPQLRNLQEWGVVLLLFFLLTLLSLHQFMKLNLEIKNWEFKDLQEKHELNPDLNKGPLITKAKEVEKISEPSKKLWLIITLAIWLFIPLIKPIEDENINIGAPFRQLTLFNDVMNAIPGLQSGETEKKPEITPPTFLIRIDSVFIKDPSKNELPKEVRDQLDNIEKNSNKALDRIDEIKEE